MAKELPIEQAVTVSISDVAELFSNEMKTNPDLSAGVAAIKTLFHVIQQSKCNKNVVNSVLLYY